MAAKLTKRTIDALSPRAKRYDLYDNELPGFALRVTPDGVKSFSVLYRAGSGRSAPKRRITLGRFGPLTVENARVLARKALAEVAGGADPASERNARQSAPSVAYVGVEYLADVKARRKTTTAAEYVRLWNKHVVPSMGERRVEDVTAAHVAVLQRSLRETPYVANRVLALIGAFFTYAERQGLRVALTNPARSVEPFPEAARERFLSAAEVAGLGVALTHAARVGLPPWRDRRRAKPETIKHRPKAAGQPIPANPFAVSAIRFLLLTGWREREALRLRWTEVDLERGTATLPDTKTGRSARSLSAPAQLLLSELPRRSGSPYVFPGSTPDRPLANVNALWFAVRHAAKLDDVRLHDLRHTFASTIAAGGSSLLIIGKLLGHKDTATTAKYAHLADDPVREAGDRAANTLSRWLTGKAARTRKTSRNKPSTKRSARVARTRLRIA
jgi:integrase